MMNALSEAMPRDRCLGLCRLNFSDPLVVCSVCAQHRNPGRASATAVLQNIINDNNGQSMLLLERTAFC